MIKPPLERDIQSSILEYLFYRAKSNMLVWRQNTHPTFNQKAERYQAMPKYSRKGVPDILVVKDSIMYGLEVKRPGSKQSPDQRLFEQDLIAAGGKYYVVTSIEDVVNLGF